MLHIKFTNITIYSIHRFEVSNKIKKRNQRKAYATGNLFCDIENFIPDFTQIIFSVSFLLFQDFLDNLPRCFF